MSRLLKPLSEALTAVANAKIVEDASLLDAADAIARSPSGEWIRDNRGAILSVAGGISAAFLVYKLSARIPLIRVPLEPMETQDHPAGEVNFEIDPNMPLTLPNRPGKIQCYDPTTCARIGEVPDMTPAEVTEVIKKALKAQATWRETSFATRRRFIELLLKYTLEEMDTICRVSMRESGKVKMDAVLGEITPTVEKMRWVIANGEATLKPDTRGGQGLLTLHKRARLEYRPLGVIAVFAPFNYAFTNMMNHIISGCFAGNGVVCKVSEFTSLSSVYYSRIVRKALIEVGGDPDLCQVVTGLAPAGATLASSPLIHKIIFTGSDKIGKLIMKQASDNLTPCVLELGGKDPFVVCGDVRDLNRVARIAARGTFQNCGQNCIGIERIFVEKSVAEPFIDRLVALCKGMRQGRGLDEARDGTVFDIGAMCTLPQFKHVQGLIADAVAKGATLHFGGKREERLAPGLFIRPTVLSGVTPEMRIVREEVFGPVACIRVFDSERQLIEMMNDCPFALGSSVFSGNRARAERIGKACHAGMCNLNDFGINYLVQSLPFGGTKFSGYGRFGGAEGLRECCQLVSVTEDAFPVVAETDIPRPLTYPIAKSAPATGKALIQFAYGDGLLAKLGGLLALLGGLAMPRY